MTDSTPQENPAFTAHVVLERPYRGQVRTDIPYAGSANEALTLDVYYPQKRSGLLPAVILVTGFSDTGFQSRLGMVQKQVGWYSSWARLLAASGLIAITYTNTEPDRDALNLIAFLQEQGAALGIDARRLGVMAMSSNVANALAVVMSDRPVRCAALWYGYTMDLGDSRCVAAAQAQYGFRTVVREHDEFPQDLPILIARAGLEENPGLNESIDRFVAEALRRNAPVSLVNYAAGKHCFDILDDSQESVNIVRQAVEFLRFHLGLDAHEDEATAGEKP